ncbi:MAG: NAD(P)H-binding protein [Gammaproteobacteria bacterium]|nr:NAD(P)H-binding protein [Gammaproteobacteria bacterium]MDH3428610.1 NAD(P)H-binding protein [Gammaproteobacteria bacterium]MDH3433306.1 NAD(P)H-binding protein [Gammaproteobacteria bacterium]
MIKTTVSRVFLFAAVLFAAMTAASAEGEQADELKILVYGATGKVGTHVVDEALQRGHFVTAVSRDPSRIQRRHPHLSVVAGDLLDAESIADLAVGQDVIVISVRGIIGKSKKPENAIQRIAVEKVVNVLREIGDDAPRLIHVGGSGTLEVEPGVLWADKIPKIFVPKSLELEIQGQVLALDYLRTVSDVKWSYATPAKNFTNGERSGVFRIGGDALLEDARGKSRISRADFAVALIDEAENAAHVRQRFSVAY